LGNYYCPPDYNDEVIPLNVALRLDRLPLIWGLFNCYPFNYSGKTPENEGEIKMEWQKIIHTVSVWFNSKGWSKKTTWKSWFSFCVKDCVLKLSNFNFHKIQKVNGVSYELVQVVDNLYTYVDKHLKSFVA